MEIVTISHTPDEVANVPESAKMRFLLITVNFGGPISSGFVQ
jgi:hypothetical protein